MRLRAELREILIIIEAIKIQDEIWTPAAPTNFGITTKCNAKLKMTNETFSMQEWNNLQQSAYKKWNGK